jgi:hypothetical protein
MRCSYLLILFLTSLLLSVPATTHAQRRRVRRSQPNATSPTASRQPHRSALSGNGQTGGDEQQVMARVRGYQMQLEREEKALNQRLAYAAQLRQQGLEKKDQNLLDQAEQYERKALATYQGRVKQYEKANLNPGARARAAKAGIDSNSGKTSQPTTRTRRRSSRNRSSKSAKSAWSWLR